MAGLVDPAPPALHGMAPGLRGDRRLPGATRQPDAAGGHTAGVLVRRRVCRARARRVARASLGTHIPGRVLVAVTVVGLAGAVALGVAGLSRVGWALIPFLVLGPLLVVAYNLELFGGLVHTDAGFALAWGSFPVLVAYVAQTGRLALSPVIAAAAAFALSVAQRRLSTPARLIRRRATRWKAASRWRGGRCVPIDERMLLGPAGTGPAAMSWAVVLLAASVAVARLG